MLTTYLLQLGRVLQSVCSVCGLPEQLQLHEQLEALVEGGDLLDVLLGVGQWLMVSTAQQA